jgi:hypothetical protein
MFTVIPPDNKSVLVENQGHRDHHGDDTPYRPAERLKDAISGSLAQVLEQIGSSVVSVEKNGRSAELAVEKIGAAGQLATERTAAAVASANASNFANTQNLLIEGFKDGRYDAATLTASILQGQVVGFKDGRYDAATFAASILQSQVEGFKDSRYDAAVNTAAMQAAMAECCCELKGAIASEGDETRALMVAIDGRRADRELVDAKGEATLLKLQLAQVARTTPVVV